MTLIKASLSLRQKLSRFLVPATNFALTASAVLFAQIDPARRHRIGAGSRNGALLSAAIRARGVAQSEKNAKI